MSNTSLASTFPPEILCSIFFETLPKRRSRYQIPQEVVLSHVCAHWRDVVIGFARLWADIDIYSADSIVWLPSYIERSKPCLLNLRLDTYEIDKKLLHSSCISLRPIFNIVVDHIDRVRSFFWFTFAETTVEGLRCLFNDLAAPALQQFRIVANRHHTPWRISGTSHTIFNGGVPKLSLVDLEATWTLPRLENVTTLMLGLLCAPEGSTFANELLKIASSAPNLTHLSIDKTIRASTFPDGPPTAFVFNSLQSLRLVTDPTPFILHFLRVLQAPQLESLWLGCRPFDSLTPCLANPSFKCGTKFPSLRYLTVQNYDFSNSATISTAFPTVTHLHLLYPHNSSMGVATFFSSPTAQWWPNVHTLIIQTTHDAFNGDNPAPNNAILQLRTLIPRRRQINVPIKTVLFDRDLHRIAARSDWVGEKFTMGVISPENYGEYWWNLYENGAVRIT